jgi:hypothetical protein
MSGCYRPKYFANIDSKGTENNLVRKLEPVVVTVSDQLDNGYAAGNCE